MPIKRLTRRARVALFLVLALPGFLSGPVRAVEIKSASAAHSWLEISQSAFEENIRTLQKLVGDQVKICAVMKADAYGHGIELLMPSIVALQVPCVGITSNQEARLARAKGFTGQLVRLRTATLGEVEEALDLRVEELVGNLGYGKNVSAIAGQHGRTIRYHLALNSAGMSRNGLELKVAQGREDALALLQLPHLEIVGIMTHFPVDDVADVRKGLAAFNEESAWVMAHGKLDRKKITLHTANTFTTLSVPEAWLDMVRPGGALYGEVIPGHPEYKRVMEFKTRVAVVNHYPAGNTVNYDRTYTLKRDSALANIPVGYSDGVRRIFSNRGHVLIRGKKLPIIGRVTMNTIMVDVTDAPEVQASDEVVLFGKQGNLEITQDDLEKDAETILDDLSTMWGNSNPKLLVK